MLVGDAASCVSLFGDGSSLAMAGAHTLASAMGDFARYKAAHRKLVEPKQRNIGRASAMLVPKTHIGLATRNLAARAASHH